MQLPLMFLHLGQSQLVYEQSNLFSLFSVLDINKF